jgi:hypothetical protein
MLVFMKLAADLPRGCAGGRSDHLLFATHPHHASIREWFYASTVSEDSHHSGYSFTALTSCAWR